MKKLIVILLALSVNGMSQKLIIKDNVKFLALGDSYTIGESLLKANAGLCNFRSY